MSIEDKAKGPAPATMTEEYFTIEQIAPTILETLAIVSELIGILKMSDSRDLPQEKLRALHQRVENHYKWMIDTRADPQTK